MSLICLGLLSWEASAGDVYFLPLVREISFPEGVVRQPVGPGVVTRGVNVLSLDNRLYRFSSKFQVFSLNNGAFRIVPTIQVDGPVVPVAENLRNLPFRVPPVERNGHVLPPIAQVENPLPPKPVLRKRWTLEEEDRLRAAVAKYGEENWDKVAGQISPRTPKQCRQRWKQYLCPRDSQASWTSEEDALLRAGVEQVGTRWGRVASLFPNRSALQISNRWHTLTRRTADRQGGSSQMPQSNLVSR